MEGFKNILASKTVWGVVITAVFAVLDAFNVNVGFGAAEASELVTKLGEFVGLAFALYGRITATKQIGSAPAP